MILVPTDFSENARQAFRYAYAIAKEFDSSIHVVHSYLPFYSAFQSEESNEGDRLRAEEEAWQGMEEFLQPLDASAKEDEIKITAGFFKGNLVEAFSQWLDESQPDLVVMGTKGASGLKHTLLGSNTLDIGKASPIPVLIVPPDVETFKLDNIIFFTDYNQQDIHTLTQLNMLFGSQSISCRLVHIHHAKENLSEDAHKKMEAWVSFLMEKTDINGLSWEVVYGKENIDVIDNVAEQNGADLLVLTLIEKGFFEKLFNKSLAKTIILQPKKPVLLINPQEAVS